MIATGRLIAEPGLLEQNNNCLIGLEYVGFNKRRQRIMGVCSHR